MKAVIMGCSRVGARLAEMLSEDGCQVTVLDIEANSFKRLSQNFNGTALLGNGLDEATLVRAGIETADAFVAVTQGDNRNIMASQIARHIFKVPRVVCRIYDPLRRDLYSELGLITISSTTVVANMVKNKLFV
ncbi:MAG: TrkA family potassium uptake protein [Dehalococcoidales bacterium]|nr:TrkA family potassium uptake protein [Dehalococcoidales bacterium]MDD4465813.1 TrkA family potassium uptake protein [Dehalococcoidales bacterium]